MSAHSIALLDERPFTVPSLASRWECSEGLIRKMIDRGELASFRIGALIRIPADEVGRIECQLPTASNDSERDTPLSGGTKTTSEEGAASTPKIGRARKQKRGGFGQGATIHHGPWEG